VGVDTSKMAIRRISLIFEWLCNQETQMGRDYSMSRVLYSLICVVWLFSLRVIETQKEPPALAAGGSRKATWLVQEPHHP